MLAAHHSGGCLGPIELTGPKIKKENLQCDTNVGIVSLPDWMQEDTAKLDETLLFSSSDHRTPHRGTKCFGFGVARSLLASETDSVNIVFHLNREIRILPQVVDLHLEVLHPYQKLRFVYVSGFHVVYGEA